jgi:hypothetical protein
MLETIDTKVNSGFLVVCPALPTLFEKITADDVCRITDHPALVLELSVDFTVRPDKKWSTLHRFKNAKCERCPYYVVSLC